MFNVPGSYVKALPESMNIIFMKRFQSLPKSGQLEDCPMIAKKSLNGKINSVMKKVTIDVIRGIAS
jgi:hypothetical protein